MSSGPCQTTDCASIGQPAYEDEPGVEVLGSGSKPVEETVTAKYLLFPVQLNDGVLSPASSRRLDRMRYHFAGDWQQGSGRCAVLQKAPSMRSADGQTVCAKLEQFCLAGRGRPCVLGDGDPPTPHLVHFQGRTELQVCLRLGEVDFAEIFLGLRRGNRAGARSRMYCLGRLR